MKEGQSWLKSGDEIIRCVKVEPRIEKFEGVSYNRVIVFESYSIRPSSFIFASSLDREVL